MTLPLWLGELGFQVRALALHVEIPTPHDFMWQWPNAFVEVGLQRLVEIGRMSGERAEGVRRAFARSQSTPGAFQITPTVIEIIAEKPR